MPLLVQSMLGLLPLAPRRTLIIDPDLPEWLPELELSDIRVGKARVSLRFHRGASGDTEHEITACEGDLRVWRPVSAPVPGADRFVQSLLGALFG